jgi:hypothetical protein
MVRLSADHSRQTHMQAFHAACADKSARAGQYLAEARSTKARVVSETERAILRARKALGMGLVESERLCLLGLGMARAARIEAVHGGRHASMLTQVASELEQAVGEIRERVGLLRRQFRDGTAHPPAAPARSLSAVPAASVPVPRVPECV